MTSFKGYFEASNNWIKFLILSFTLLFSILVLSVLIFFEAFILKIPASEVQNIVNNPEASGILYLRIMQITQHVVVFLAPAVVTAYLISGSWKQYMHLSSPANKHNYLLAVAIMISAIPLVNYLNYYNIHLNFSGWLSGFEAWAREKEAFTNQLLNLFFIDNRWVTLLINIFMMAVIPSIAEEFLFRGLIQQLVIKSVKNIHIGILITAVIFSAMHMQFLGFIPRVFLGMVLGYLFVWTGSIWVSVLAHFMNNFIGVVCLQLLNEQQNKWIENIGTPDGMIIILLPATIVFTGLIYLLYLRKVESKEFTS